MQNRRESIVVNKQFQHHYALLFVACTVVFSNLLIIIGALYPGEDHINLTLGLSISIAIVELVLLFGVWRASLHLTHRIAGPVYVFTREIGKFAGGDLSARIRLRQADLFQEEAKEINTCLEKLEDILKTNQGGAQ